MGQIKTNVAVCGQQHFVVSPYYLGVFLSALQNLNALMIMQTVSFTVLPMNFFGKV